MRTWFLALTLVGGCSFGGNPNQVPSDADVLPPPPDADPTKPDARVDARVDASLPDAPPGTPDAPPDANVAQCGAGYAPITGGFPAGTTYRAVNVRTQWADARADCQGDGADLVVIDNAIEAEAVAAIVEDPGSPPPQPSPYFWVGVFDPTSGGDNNFTTVLGTPPPYLPWAFQQPSGGSQDCVLQTDTGPPSTYYDYGCTAIQVYVCECLL